MKKSNKKDRISYYVGWGLAYGAYAGGIFHILLPKHSLVMFYLEIVFGAVIGAIYGKWKIRERNF